MSDNRPKEEDPLMAVVSIYGQEINKLTYDIEQACNPFAEKQTEYAQTAKTLVFSSLRDIIKDAKEAGHISPKHQERLDLIKKLCEEGRKNAEFLIKRTFKDSLKDNSEDGNTARKFQAEHQAHLATSELFQNIGKDLGGIIREELAKEGVKPNFKRTVKQWFSDFLHKTLDYRKAEREKSKEWHGIVDILKSSSTQPQTQATVQTSKKENSGMGK